MINFMRRHWMLFSALGIAAFAAGITGLVVGLAPVLPILTGATILGFAPFAFLATMSVAVAAIVVASITAAVVLAAAIAFNVLYSITRKLDKLLTPPKPYEVIAAVTPIADDAKNSSSSWSKLKAFLCCGEPSKDDNNSDALQSSNANASYSSPLISSQQSVLLENDEQSESNYTRV
ncbi:MAG: hypothetical protein Q8M03_17110 [Legionella sp.]|nr:hypothetical protein [Legionella sp.]